MRKYFVCLLGLTMVFGFIGVSSAAIVTDSTGDQLGVGNTDITSARAELTTRGDGELVLKLTVNATPNIGGAIMFEADVDNSTGTGGSLGMTGIAGTYVNPCSGTCSGACKTVVGTDIVVAIFNRLQGATAVTAINDTLTGPKARIPGEWYATSMALTGSDYVGMLRGFTDPTPTYNKTSHSYTLPWASICAFVNAYSPEKFGVSTCEDPANVQWQLISFYDPVYSDLDDLQNNVPLCMGITDWVPNVGLVNGFDAGDAITYCEGNFDGNLTVDGLDAAKFKSDFGRSGIKNPCPTANYMW